MGLTANNVYGQLVNVTHISALKLLPPPVVRFREKKCMKIDFGWSSVPDPAAVA